MDERITPKPWHRSKGKVGGTLLSSLGIVEIGASVLDMVAGPGTGDAARETMEGVATGSVQGILGGLAKLALGLGIIGIRRRQDR